MMISACLVMLLTSCAIQFQDRNDVIHLIGFGHMKMKVPGASERKQAVIYGTETIGLTVGKTAAGHHVSAGWFKQEQLDIIDENSSIRLERPESSLFTIEIGSEPPDSFIQKTQEDSLR